MTSSRSVSRRTFLAVGGAATATAVAGCSAANTLRRVLPTDSLVGVRESQRHATGKVTRLDLRARPVQVDLAGRQVSTWAYESSLARPEIRVRAGDRLRATLINDLPESSSVHWHGLALRNNMDGVPGTTQRATPAGGRFSYDFVVPDAGTYWYHSHAGTQLDRGLYAPLVVEDPAEQGVDVDQVLVLDDWLDGVAGTPDQELATLRKGMSMGGSGGMAMSNRTSSLLGADAGDVTYPLHLVNGRPPADRPTVTAPPRGKVRLRLINAGSDTAYRFAVGGHRLTVTHTDGRPVRPVTVDAVLLGMGERYDVELTARSGAWPMVALAEGKTGQASAVLRTTDARRTTAPPATSRPAELSGSVLRYGQLTPAEGQLLASRRPDRRYTLDLVGNMGSYQWGLGGDAKRLQVRQGERIRIAMRNSSPMWHPMHLHGHTFAVVEHGGLRKDTVNVLPGQTVTIDVEADNPGQWLYHCHNLYHLSLGMMTTLSYVA